MKLIGILSWYDEPTSWLASCIARLPKIGITHLVAVDGAYELFPNGKARSGEEQHATIAGVAAAVGMGCTIHVPETVWAGNEVEKRNASFAIAEAIAEPNRDWYFIVDADHFVEEGSPDVRPALERWDGDAAEVRLFSTIDPYELPDAAAEHLTDTIWPREQSVPCPCVFRAIPGLHYERAHYRVCTPEGRLVWGNVTGGDVVPPALELPVRVEHRRDHRELGRVKRRDEYYRVRDAAGIKRGPCHSCGGPSALTLPTGWTEHPQGLEAGWVEACSECAPALRKESADQVRAFGYDPAELQLSPSAVGG